MGEEKDELRGKRVERRAGEEGCLMGAAAEAR